MLRLAGQKMLHKKWMNLSLLIGCILLIGTMVSFPIYQDAAYDRMLQDEFTSSFVKEGKWPTSLYGYIFSERDKKGSLKKVDKKLTQIPSDLGVSTKEYVTYYSLPRFEVKSDLNRQDAQSLFFRLGSINDLEEHINIIAGNSFSDKGITDEGCIEVILSKNALVSTGALLGETFEYTALKDADGNPIKVVIQGVYEPKDVTDTYWQAPIYEKSDACLTRMDVFKDVFTDHPEKFSLQCEYWLLFEFSEITHSDVSALIEKTHYYTDESILRQVLDDPGYMEILDRYERKLNRISATLNILQLPVLVLLCAFLFMISGQMYEMEKNEISVIKSRGASSGQLFRMYLYQGMVLTGLGALLGVPLSILFSRVLGATRNFLEFHMNERLEVSFTSGAVKYLVIGCLLCMGSLTIPAIKHSRTSIVHLKQSRAVKKKPLWQKLYLDVILIGVSIYGYYNFHKNLGDVAVTVLSGESLDPLLYVSSSLMILGLGLLFLRVRPLLILVLFKPLENKWGPSNFVAFMENIRNSGKVSLIMLFMIMTVSLGIYHAAVARTILDNAVENTKYLSPTDVVVKEEWIKSIAQDGTVTGYIEPDYSKYQKLELIDDVTRVMLVENGYSSKSKSDQVTATIMGIHTKEFGMETSIDTGLNEKLYREYLNELSQVKDGVILSTNFRDQLGYKIGDTISYHANKSYSANGKIVDFVDYWPGFSPYINIVNPDGSADRKDNYLIVAQFDYLRNQWGVAPYEVWINLKPDVSASDIAEWITDKNLHIQKYESRETNIEDTMSDPLLQGTNGILTLGFVVTLLLCVIGYLIYWIMAIRERELMFGVLRATGFHKGELIWVLINEQIFTGFIAVLAGVGIGKLTSRLFVPILQQAYASENQVLPMKLISQNSDMLKIYAVIALALILSLAVLTIILFSMNVTKALKLGEE